MCVLDIGEEGRKGGRGTCWLCGWNLWAGAGAGTMGVSGVDERGFLFGFVGFVFIFPGGPVNDRRWRVGWD